MYQKIYYIYFIDVIKIYIFFTFSYQEKNIFLFLSKTDNKITTFFSTLYRIVDILNGIASIDSRDQNKRKNWYRKISVEACVLNYKQFN